MRKVVILVLVLLFTWQWAGAACLSEQLPPPSPVQSPLVPSQSAQSSLSPSLPPSLSPLQPSPQDSAAIPASGALRQSADMSENKVPESSSDLLNAGVVSEPVGPKLESLTKQIAQKEMQLLRLNTDFLRECTKVGKLKPTRLFLYNLAASGCATAGSASITGTRWHYWTDPRMMPRSTALTGPTLLLIAHCIVIGGVATEGAIDAIDDHRVEKKGLDIGTTRKRVLGIKGELDSMLAEHEKLLAEPQGLTGDELAIAKTEEDILKDVRDLSLIEYAQLFVRAHKFFANRNTNSIVTLFAAGTGGFGGSLLGIVAIKKREPRLNGPGGINFIVSGATIVLTPETIRLAANLAGNAAEKKIASQLTISGRRSIADLDTHRARLEQLLAKTNTNEHPNILNTVRRLTGYQQQTVLFNAQTISRTEEQYLADKELKERMFFAAAIGGPKISWGANLCNAGFGYHKAPPVITPETPTEVAHPGRLLVKRIAIGGTSYLPGNSMWTLDTLQSRVREERRNQMLASQKTLPALLLEERMARVRQIDSVFNY